MKDIRLRAQQGYVQEEIVLAAAYLAGRGVPRDEAQAAHWYERAAAAGNPEAQNEIGYFYQAGIGVQSDAERAVHWFQLSSAAGFAGAKVNLGVSYLNGIGVRKDASMAKRLFTDAVDHGSGLGATYLGVMDYFGVGVPVNKAEAEHWFETGTKLHDPESAYDLAVLYVEAIGPAHDLRRAAALLRYSAQKGYVPAKHSLGVLLVNHPELAESDMEAQSVLEQGSQAGNWRSSVLLGILARDGRGEKADPGRAFYYFHLASLQGGKEAQRLVERDKTALKPKLTQEQQTAIITEASGWFDQHPDLLMYVSAGRRDDDYFPLIAVVDREPRP